ncbi:MAG: M48 family metallopeptidase [Acidimicrobiia bacterium]|nr:M48 family metallopeptidase [Acidimicrobiia bacterium]
MIHRYVVALSSLALLASACTVDGDSVNQWDVNVFPLDVEWQLGEQMAAQLAPSLTVVDDEAVQAYVQDRGDELVAHTELAERPWVFTVIDDPTVNAFALPGGRIYVHSGLLQAIETEEQLLGVLAHEISHVEARHSTERLTTEYGISLVGAALLGDDAGLLEQLATQVLTAGATAKFSRDDEREADRLGLVTLGEAGEAPESMASFFRVLLAEQQRRPSSVEQFFATHPLTEDRVDDVLERSAGVERVGERRAEPGLLEAVQARLR